MNIFDKALQDTEILVKVAALKAIAAFISAIDDQDTVMEFAPVLPALLETIVTVLQSDEEQGRQALESLADLTGAHPEVWKSTTAPLVKLVSEVCSHTDFEDGTRSAAIEVLLSLSAEMPAALRKIQETKTLFFPALVKMLMEDDRDDETWAEEVDDADKLATDPVSTASSSLQRFAADLGEKTTLAAVTPIIAELRKPNATNIQK